MLQTRTARRPGRRPSLRASPSLQTCSSGRPRRSAAGGACAWRSRARSLWSQVSSVLSRCQCPSVSLWSQGCSASLPAPLPVPFLLPAVWGAQRVDFTALVPAFCLLLRPPAWEFAPSAAAPHSVAEWCTTRPRCRPNRACISCTGCRPCVPRRQAHPCDNRRSLPCATPTLMRPAWSCLLPLLTVPRPCHPRCPPARRPAAAGRAHQPSGPARCAVAAGLPAQVRGSVCACRRVCVCVGGWVGGGPGPWLLRCLPFTTPCPCCACTWHLHRGVSPVLLLWRWSPASLQRAACRSTSALPPQLCNPTRARTHRPSRWPKTLIVVSHAREFLNTVCTDVLHLHSRSITAYRVRPLWARLRRRHALYSHRAARPPARPCAPL